MSKLVLDLDGLLVRLHLGSGMIPTMVVCDPGRVILSKIMLEEPMECFGDKVSVIRNTLRPDYVISYGTLVMVTHFHVDMFVR